MTNPDIKVTPELLEEQELLAIKKSAANVFEKIASSPAGTDIWTFRESLWPAFGSRSVVKPELVLVPLSRLGAVQGYSGNRVLIGYFVDDGSNLFPSRPMVIKLSASNEATKLKDEQERAASVRHYLAYFPGEFALPIHFDVENGYGVLWSPFSSSTPLLMGITAGTGSRLALGIEDMWYHLRKRPTSPISTKLSPADLADPARSPAKDIDANLDRGINLKDSMVSIYELLKPLHMANGTAERKKRSPLDEYRKYLRGADAPGWGELWHSIWASKDRKEIQVQGAKRINPFWVLEQIANRSIEYPIYCGGVHGDLHPKNILFSDHRTPHVIDFGWAAPDSHVAKDFVLLECNLRFMVLSPEIAENHIDHFTKWIGFEDPSPRVTDHYCQARIELVGGIRAIARARFPPGTDWDTEYIIPLFLVALGLMKHLRDTDNQLSAMQTVLALAEHVSKALSFN